ncbi:MAG: hypothetical protein Kow0092_31080 [Deferrisomatales bacterium]
MKKCERCPHRTEECPDSADGALLALGPFWGGADRDCPRDFKKWREEADAALEKK